VVPGWVNLEVERIEGPLLLGRETTGDPPTATTRAIQVDVRTVTAMEVYLDEAGFKAHQQTPHYLTWKATVADMMAGPRVGEKHHQLFPKPWQ
jgi:hypothetical protein